MMADYIPVFEVETERPSCVQEAVMHRAGLCLVMGTGVI